MESELEKALKSQGLKKVEGSTYSLNFPNDHEGRVGRECFKPECSPAYFKVKPGTGINSEHYMAFCPYCRAQEDSGRFYTKEQQRYLTAKINNATEVALTNVMQKAFSSHSRNSRSGLFSISFKVGPPKLRHVLRPFENELQREVVCPHCGLDHAVYGLAFWCPDCGADIFLEHVRKEFQVISTILEDVERRRGILGARVAARDVENCLEDTVSLFEAVMKIIVRRRLTEDGLSKDEIEKIFGKKIGNAFQNVERATKEAKAYLGVDLWSSLTQSEQQFVSVVFEKRHPITHNLGVVDRKYIEKSMTLESEGREVRVAIDEVKKLGMLCLKVLCEAWITKSPIKTLSEPTQAGGVNI